MLTVSTGAGPDNKKEAAGPISGSMKIVLVNSAVPACTWKKSYRPHEYEEALRRWEALPVETGPVHTLKHEGYYILRASSAHAGQTGELLFGQEAAGLCQVSPLLDEIRRSAFTDEDREISLRQYEWQGYRQWKKGDPRQPESRAVSLDRAEELCSLLEKRGQDVVLISHPRRIMLLLEVLKKRKYQVRRGSIFRPAPMERILASREILTCGGCRHNCQLSNPGCAIGRDKAMREMARRKKK